MISKKANPILNGVRRFECAREPLPFSNILFSRSTCLMAWAASGHSMLSQRSQVGKEEMRLTEEAI